MKPNKILSASLIDLIFDGRNKEYGAYELRKNDSQRTKVALSLTISIVALVLTITTLANSYKKDAIISNATPGVVLTAFDETKPPEELPKPEVKPQVEPTQTQKFTEPKIVDKEILTDPPPSVADLDSSLIGLETIKGKPHIFTASPPEEIGGSTGILDKKITNEDDEIRTTVDVPAKFEGNWVRFLQTNLNAETPVNNGAGPGRYSVVVQFVVDKEGNVSDIKALTNHGYGVEEEAVRVLKKAPKWQPAIAAGYTVKAYHKQVIVFEVVEE